MKLYTVNSWYDVDLLCNDDVDYIDSSKLLVDYESYKLLKARNVELEAERDAMRNKLDEWDEWSIRFKEWGNAYPLDIFPEVEDWAAVREALQKDGLTIGRVSASCMRHVITTLINMLPIPQGGAEGEG